MKIENVVEITKSGIAQALGSEYAEKIGTLSPTNSGALADLGTKVTSAQSFEQLFLNGVLETMGKLEIEDVVYKSNEFNSMMIDKDMFPGFMARIYFEPSDNIMSDPSFSLESGKNYAELEHKYFGAKYSEKIFDMQMDLLGAMSYSQEELITAFRGWEEMNSFLSGKRASILSIIDLRLNVWKHMLAQSAIAQSITQKSAIHLVTDYKKINSTFDKTGVNALYDREFLAYISEVISNTKDYIKRMSTAFNNKEHVTFSTNTNLWLLSAVENRIRYGLRADTFNEKLLSFGDYETITAWQGVATSEDKFDISTLSTVMLDNDSVKKFGLTANSETNFVQPGVIGLLADWRAIGITIIREYANTSVTASASFTTDFYHYLTRAILDSNYPIVAFILD